MRYKEYKRVVIKIGSNILTEENGKLDLNNLRHLVEQIAAIHLKGIEVCVVTSGAQVCGSEKLGILPKSIPEKQAVAAIGQSLLMNEYNRFFSVKGITIGQLLLTHDGLSHNERYINAQNTLLTLINGKVVPIINENDSVVVDEIKFGDNDSLSVYVTELVNANALIILTDIDGLYSMDPRKFDNAELIAEVSEISAQLLDGCGTSTSGKGTGGMYSKVCAAKKAVDLGVNVIIANGRRKNVIFDIFSGEKVGTKFLV
ncbi:MAG: glutamate 5-kinase [Candidatus Margulisiibacteriota bacterium]|nr:MAG: glutamate 5-kinase [Candidatus Margulisbacteria bacterium GWD2_39_127]OGI03731.1 MAG: glutamate 5-kinase [Candidatus Margulisbacteria bacterium GWF2_38_17]OGI06851.1 MAG: glutamate 5-kinase [Candidatus Margulisbacteria bacterium GWE2_39_32]PZM77054.1 MAG: glutamate 5-kinase [Candidatus Margulisiibacteriota bacterium]HAR64446.1 glutamate 5-kinase [Candidatus Margulisiibacteriota bacterium]